MRLVNRLFYRRIYHSAAEAPLAEVNDRVLPGRYSALRRIEFERELFAVQVQCRGKIGLTVPRFSRTAQFVPAAVLAYYIEPAADKRATKKLALVAARHYQSVILYVLVEHEPPAALALDAAYSESSALTERVIHKPVVPPNRFAVAVHYVARSGGKISRKELFELALADKAYTRTVFFSCDGQSEFFGYFSDLRLFEFAEGNITPPNCSVLT